MALRDLVVRMMMVWVCFSVSVGYAGQPFYQQIDQIIERDADTPPAQIVDDATYLRRLSLDLLGTIPSTDEVRAFIDDKTPDKRVRIVDQFLSHPRFNQNMATFLDVMLMERRPVKHVKADKWRAYLVESMASEKPYNQMVAELLAADGVDPNQRSLARFYLGREAESHLITNDISRILLGRNLQCAQCHNHPDVDDYMQDEYYGLHAFVSRSYLFTDKQKKTFVAEKADGDTVYKSVFQPSKISYYAKPRIIGGKVVDEPKFPVGESYDVQPAKDVRPVPKFSLRKQLAQQLSGTKNKTFAANFANRVWAHLMGRGLVEPVDFHHASNPPSHPELLDRLADSFTDSGYDIRSLIREIALSNTYQRAVDPVDLIERRAEPLAAELPKLKLAKAALEGKIQESGKKLDEAEDVLIEKAKAQNAVADEVAKLKAAVVAAEKAVVTERANKAKTGKDIEANKANIQTLQDAVAKSNAAVKLLKDDKAVTPAVKAFQARIDEFGKQIETLTKKLATHDKTIADAVAKHAKASKPVDDAQPKLKQVDDEVAKVQAGIDQILATQAVHQHALARTERRLETIQAVIDFKTHRQAIAAGTAKLGALRDALPKLRNEVQALSTQLASQRTALQQAQSAATAKLQQFQTALASHTQPVQQSNSAIQAFVAEAAKQPEAVGVDRLVALRSQAKHATERWQALAELLAKESGPTSSHLQQVAKLNEAVTALTKQLAGAKSRLVDCESQLAALPAKIATDQEAAAVARRTMIPALARELSVRPMKALTPEQFAWSMMQSLGLMDSYERSAKAELDKERKANAAKEAGKGVKIDESKLPPITPTMIEQRLNTKIAGQVNSFVRLYGAAGGQPQDIFFATAEQALFIANGSTVQSWLRPSGNNLANRLLKAESSADFANDLYLSLLTRLPHADEIKQIDTYLKDRKDDRQTAVQEIVWAMLASTEFRFCN